MTHLARMSATGLLAQSALDILVLRKTEGVTSVTIWRDARTRSTLSVNESAFTYGGAYIRRTEFRCVHLVLRGDILDMKALKDRFTGVSSIPS